MLSLGFYVLPVRAGSKVILVFGNGVLASIASNTVLCVQFSGTMIPWNKIFVGKCSLSLYIVPSIMCTLGVWKKNVKL